MTTKPHRRSGRRLAVTILILTAVLSPVFISCNEDGLLKPDNNIELADELSAYNIFKGSPSDLVPNDGFVIYELSAQLFSDYAEKQRLIKLPEGEFLTPEGDGLPGFPDNTIIVKTFFYYNDRRDTSKGKQIIETRLLIKSGSKWTVATYMWNEEQTDARLVTSGFDTTVNWIDQQGNGKVISYHIPGNRECATCHNANGQVIPIGPKLRNLNRAVGSANGTNVNQLFYLEDLKLFKQIDPSDFSSMPDPHDESAQIMERARAYLDVNCAHCHKRDGIASDTRLFLEYELSLDDTRISRKKNRIEALMSEGYMPQLGTTLVDQEGLELIKKYLQGL